MNKLNQPIRCFVSVPHPEEPAYLEWHRTSNLAAGQNTPPIPYPPLRIDFTMNHLPSPGDTLLLTHCERDIKYLVKDRVFFAASGSENGETAVKLEVEPAR